DWVAMNFMNKYLNEEQYRERQRNVIADLKALQVLEMTIRWLVSWSLQGPQVMYLYMSICDACGWFEDRADETTMSFQDWDVSSASVQLVHILNEPSPPFEYSLWGGEDDTPVEVRYHSMNIPREMFLEGRANEFITLAKPGLLPAL